jgi:hypothetical protein
MLSEAKHLAFSGGYEVEILRLRLRMTIATQSLKGEEGNPGNSFDGATSKKLKCVSPVF